MESYPFEKANNITDEVLNILRYIIDEDEESTVIFVQSGFTYYLAKYIQRYAKES